MACDRCEDIHKAQRNGKTNQKCECDCHIIYNTGTGNFGQVCTCGQGQTTTGYCPVHGHAFMFQTGSGADTCCMNPPTLRLEPYLIQP